MKETRFGAIPDCHIPQEDERALNTALKVLEWYKPHEIVILGDFLDCAPVSHWNRKNLRERKNMNMASDFKLANKYLDRIQKITENVTYLQGNHEKWLDDAIDEQPEMDGLLNLEINLHFATRGINYLKYNECYSIGKLAFTHGIYTNQHHALKHCEKFGRSIAYGHLHDVQMAISVSPIDVEDKHMGVSLGCLAKVNPAFMRNRPSNWQHCIGIGLVRPDQTFNLDPIIISGGVCSYAGKTFK